MIYVKSVTKKPMEGVGYPQDLPAVRHLSTLSFTSPVTIFCGENGTGKSTLLEGIAVACGFNPEGGTRNFQFSSCDTHSPLWRYLGLTRGARRERDGFFLRAESFYNVATNIDELDRQAASSPPIIASYGGVSLHGQSHGESFLSLMLNRFRENSLFILDEPEAALSPSRQLTVLLRMHELAGQNCQFILATHSPILLAYPGAEIYVLSRDGMVKTPYEQTEHYLVMKEFINHPQHMLHMLLGTE